MSEPRLELTRKSFDSADTNTKLGILFDMSHNTRQEVCILKEMVKRNKIIDKVYLGVCGFLGGMATRLFKWGL